MFLKENNDETNDEAGGRDLQLPLRGRLGPAGDSPIRARVSDAHTGVPPGVRGRTEVRA